MKAVEKYEKLIGKEEIKSRLLHEEPFLFLDSAIIYSDSEIVGKYKLKPDHVILPGHFPRNPILPGVILAEIAAQTGAVLICEEYSNKGINIKDYNPQSFLVKVLDFAFKQKVLPGMEIEIKVFLEKYSIENFYYIKSVISHASGIVASGSLIVYFSSDFKD